MMIDKRKCYALEGGYCRSDYSFYCEKPGSTKVDLYDVLAINNKTGNDKWYCIGTYTLKLKYSSEHVMILVNDHGRQIETCGFGWKAVRTQHEVALKEKTQYNNFLAALAECGKLAPASASRWHAEMLEAFEHTFEEQLYYGEDDV
jgi:hypothetical protein